MDKTTKIFLYVITFTIAIICIICLFSNKNKNAYDISFMNKINVDDLVNIKNSEGTYVILFAREDCDVCSEIIPYFKDIQIKNNFITQYVDIKDIDRNSDEWEEFAEILTLKSTQTLTEDNSGDAVTETYGYFLTNYGFTPTTIIIKDGVQVAGFIGSLDSTSLNEFITSKIK